MLRFVEHFLWTKVLVQWYQDWWMLWKIGNNYCSNAKALEKLCEAFSMGDL